MKLLRVFAWTLIFLIPFNMTALALSIQDGATTANYIAFVVLVLQAVLIIPAYMSFTLEQDYDSKDSININDIDEEWLGREGVDYISVGELKRSLLDGSYDESGRSSKSKYRSDGGTGFNCKY